MEKEKLMQQIEACFQDTAIRERGYYPEFRRRWVELISKAYDSGESYFDTDSVSAFPVSSDFAGIETVFHFDQLKIDDWYRQEQHRRKQVVFHPKRLSHKQGKLYFHDSLCRYDPEAAETALDEGMRNIAAAALPSLPPELRIVYGNKWVNSRFNSFFNTRISINFIETDYVPAFLASPLEICLYLFLMDYCIIKADYSKVKDEDLKNYLHIFRPSPMLKIKGIIN